MERGVEYSRESLKRERERGERTEEEERVERSQLSSERKRMRPDNLAMLSGGDLTNGYRLPDKALSPSEHVRFMDILVRLFPEQKRNVLELILKGCGGDLVQTIECVLPSHEEARARGQMLAAGARSLIPYSPPIGNGMSAFSPLPAMPHGVPMNMSEYSPTGCCPTGKCSACVYYTPLGVPVSLGRPAKDSKREHEREHREHGTPPPPILSRAHAERTSPKASVIQGPQGHKPDFNHSERAATVALMSMSSSMTTANHSPSTSSVASSPKGASVGSPDRRTPDSPRPV